MSQAYVTPTNNYSLDVNISTNIAGSLAALLSTFSGAVEPSASIRVPYMLWADTSTGTLKMRDSGNTAWWIVGPLGPAYTYVSAALGAVSATTTYALRFAPASKFIVTAVTVLSSAATTSSSGNEWQFSLLNQTTTNNLFSGTVGTFTALGGVGGGAEIAVNTAYTLTANQNQTLSANDVLRLTLTKVGAATSLADCVVQVYGTNRGA